MQSPDLALPKSDPESPLLHRLAAIWNTLQAASEQLLQKKNILVPLVQVGNEQFHTAATSLIDEIQKHATSTILALRVICRDLVKMLDSQTDVLTVSVGQIAASVDSGYTAISAGCRADMIHALCASTGIVELCKVDLKPRVSVKLGIKKDLNSVVRNLEGMAVLRLYDVDGRKSTVSGAGLMSFVKGQGAVNALKVSCMNSAGKQTEWVTAADISVILRSVDGKEIGRGAGEQTIEKGKITLKYEIDDVIEDVAEMSVLVGGTVMCGGPWRVPVCSSIKPEAVHVKTRRVSTRYSYGVAVSLDGLHLIVSCWDSHSISVYSIDTGDCITKFGSRGKGAGQFVNPHRICTTSRGTILVIEYDNKRLQEVTMTGDHVRFIGEEQLDDEYICSLCMHGDIVAVGKCSGSSDGRVMFFSYSSGAVILKFGDYGSGKGQMKEVTGLSFMADGKYILVASNVRRLLMFTVYGVFVKTIDMAGFSAFDVLCSGSNVFAANFGNHCVYVFSTETGALLRTLGSRGQKDGQFLYPTALTAHNNKLFVLDYSTPRVQVFE